MPQSEDQKRAANLISDLQLRDRLKELFAETDATQLRTFEQYRGAVQNEKDIKYAGSTAFFYSASLKKALNAVIERCIARLGPRVGHEEEIRTLLWECASKSELDISAKIKKFGEVVRDRLAQRLTFITTNHSLELGGTVQEVKIGVVCARRTKDFVAEDRRLGLHVDDTLLSVDTKFFSNISKNCWQVELFAARGHAAEEGLWLIDTALGLLRLALPPRINLALGDTEASSTLHPEQEFGGVVATAGAYDHDRWSNRKRYYIDEQAMTALDNTKLSEWAQSIFEPGNGTLAERLARGLGWQTRARKSRDRSERFLYFATAIEALLTLSDKNAPVSDTIARHAAVIMTSDPIARRGYAEDWKSLYDTRSALVHGGRREVSRGDVDHIQSFAEKLYRSVLEQVADLKMHADSFHAELKEASFGLRWRAQALDKQ